MARRQVGQHRMVAQLAKSSRAAERAIGNQLDAVRDAVLHHAVQQVLVVPDAQLHLHCGDLGDAPGLLDLADVDVAQAHTLDEALVLQRGERSHAGGERRPRIRRVELIEIDAISSQRPQAGFAGGTQVTRPSVRYPISLRPSQASFGGDDDSRAIAVPAGEGAGDESLVVAALRIVQAVSVRCVEETDSAVERRVQYVDAACLVAIPLGGEPHTADADSGVFWVRRHEQSADSRQRSE